MVWEALVGLGLTTTLLGMVLVVMEEEMAVAMEMAKEVEMESLVL